MIIKKKRIIDDLNLEIYGGEIFGLIGRSGCGKTTLFKIFLGMLSPTTGKINIEGKNIFHNKNILKKYVGFASQENMLFEELSIVENIKYFGKLYGVNKKELKSRATDLLELFELYPSRHVLLKNLSGGMKKRANILISLIHDPKILVLDEPTIGLDALLRDKIWVYINRINALGKTIIVTSHLLQELEENCHVIGIMDKGFIPRVIDNSNKKTFQKKSLRQYMEQELKDG